MLTGAVPLTLDAFTKLDINLVGDNIDELDDTFCDNDGWMAGADQRYGCKANLCPKNKYHLRGGGRLTIHAIVRIVILGKMLLLWEA